MSEDNRYLKVSELVRADIFDRAQSRANFQADLIVPPYMGLTGRPPFKGTLIRGDARNVGSYAGIDTRVLPGGVVKTPEQGEEKPVEYECVFRGLNAVIDSAHNEASGYDSETRRAAGRMADLMVQKEIRTANMAGNTSLWDGSVTLTAPDQWAASGGAINSSASPVNDMERISGLISNRGVECDTVVVSSDVASVLRTHPQLLAGGARDVDNNLYGESRIKALLSDIFNVPAARVFLMSAVWNTAGQGKTETFTPIYKGFIWAGKNLNADASVSNNSITLSSVGMFRPVYRPMDIRHHFDEDLGVDGSDVWRASHAETLVRFDASHGIVLGDILA